MGRSIAFRRQEERQPPVSRVPESEDLYGHRWPVFLPDNHHFLYVALSAAARSDNSPELHVGSLDSVRVHSGRVGRSSLGDLRLDHLLYVRGGTLYAQPFSSAERRTTGRPVPDRVGRPCCPPAFFPSPLAVSPNGVLVFQSAADLPSQLVWLDEQGREQAAWQESNTAVRPSRRMVERLAGACEGPRAGDIGDLRPRSRARCRESNYRGPARSLPGVVTGRTGDRLFRPRTASTGRPADGSGSPQIVSRRGIPTSWSPDGHSPFLRQPARRSVARALFADDARGAGAGDRRRRPAFSRRCLARLCRSQMDSSFNPFSPTGSRVTVCGCRRRAAALERRRPTALLHQRGQEADGCGSRSRSGHGKRTSTAGANANHRCGLCGSSV